MWELGILVAWDIWLARHGHPAISTRLRQQWRTHPVAATAVAAALLAHLVRPDRYAHMDVLSRVGRSLSPHKETALGVAQ